MFTKGMRVERKDSWIDPNDKHTVMPGALGTVEEYPVQHRGSNGRVLCCVRVQWDDGANMLTWPLENLIPLDDGETR